MKATNGGIVGFYSLEMSGEQLATRIISEQTEISSSKIRRGEITPADFDRLVGGSQMMQKMPLYIDQTGGMTIAQVAARARRLKRQRGLTRAGGRLYPADDRLWQIGRQPRAGDHRDHHRPEGAGKELNVPIIALSQLSRQVENREDKRPQLADLRESGSIEQDADVVLFVYREEYYTKNSEPRRSSPDEIVADIKTPEYLAWEEKMMKVKGTADVIIAKQRHGPTGTVQLGFQAEFTRFADLADNRPTPSSFTTNRARVLASIPTIRANPDPTSAATVRMAIDLGALAANWQTHAQAVGQRPLRRCRQGQRLRHRRRLMRHPRLAREGCSDFFVADANEGATAAPASSGRANPCAQRGLRGLLCPDPGP
jgi:hypothetical protein